jgi:putative copper export protein
MSTRDEAAKRLLPLLAVLVLLLPMAGSAHGTVANSSDQTAFLDTRAMLCTQSSSNVYDNLSQTIDVSCVSSLSSSLAVTSYGSIDNSYGQTVGMFVGSTSIGALGTAQFRLTIAGLPPAPYVIDFFLTTESGMVVSNDLQMRVVIA